MKIKRYNPAQYGCMDERDDGRYYHKRDVDNLVLALDCAASFIKAMRESIGGEPTGTELDVINALQEWKDESV